MPPSVDEFQGTERFQLQRKLGSGAWGVVYQALDTDTDATVALKTLQRVSPAAIYRFKREFRALADIDHHNVVKLYELINDQGQWFFTMELIDGSEFLGAIRPEFEGTSPAHSSTITRFPDLSDPGLSQEDEPQAESAARPLTEPEIIKLRNSFKQLTEGLIAIHRAGIIHRDIKPSNLRFDRKSRLVILDFGLVKNIDVTRTFESLDQNLVGTPAFMAPEQAVSAKLTPASDWYSAGAVLYQALTGCHTHSGSYLQMLTRKQVQDPPPPAELVDGIPADLNTLCCDLLNRDPSLRPDGNEILSRLSGAKPVSLPGRRSSASSIDKVFVGREKQLAILDRALTATTTGSATVIGVSGASGSGKSALVRHFVDMLRYGDPDTVVLTGRCYQRESVPYKAFDSLVDSLSRYLGSLPKADAEICLPREVLVLARVFPVLNRVDAISGARRAVLEIPDVQELRRRAFAALRELLGRLADRQQLVLLIDDMQWSDSDSLDLLAEILRPPAPPPLLLLACYRSDSTEMVDQLQTTLGTINIPFEEVTLANLSANEAEALAEELLGGERKGLARSIAEESGGNPFFIEQLVRNAEEKNDGDLSAQHGGTNRTTSLEQLVLDRYSSLEENARKLLQVVVVAAGPVDVDAAFRAAKIDSSDGRAAVANLRIRRLIRLRSSGKLTEIDAYHERIREILAASIDEDRACKLHLLLAQGLDATGRVDPEILARHFEEAGEPVRASHFAFDAAEKAATALAFDRAARLYRLAFELRGNHEQDANSLLIRLGEALENAGRGAEAAEVYLDAARSAHAGEVLELQRRAAEQLLFSGRIDDGIVAVDKVLANIGLALAPSPKRALLALVVRRLHLKIRGYKFKRRLATEIRADQLMRIDTCWAVSVGLGMVDTVRGMDFSTHHLILALEAGEPYRIARALAIEAAYSSTGGSKKAKRTRTLIDQSMRLAEEVGHPHARGLARMTAGIAAYLEGRWRQATDLVNSADTILREQCTGVTWELDTTMQYQLRAMLFEGRMEELVHVLPGLLQEVRERGDIYAETNLRSRFTWLSDLLQDQPEAASREVAEAMAKWSRGGFHIQHYWAMTGEVEIALYKGRGEEAWAAVERHWPLLKASMLLRIELTRLEAWSIRGRAALAGALSTGDERLLSIADKTAQKMAKEGVAWASPLAAMIKAGVSMIRSETEACLRQLTEAASGFETVDMPLHVAAARWRRAQLIGDRGRDLLDKGTSVFRQQKIQAPERFLRVLAPGWQEPTE